MSAAAWTKVMQRAESMPQVQRLDQFIKEARGERDTLQRELDMPLRERRKNQPYMYEVAGWNERKRHEQIRAWVSLGSWALAFGLTRIPALAPVAPLIWIGTFLGAVPKLYDRYALPRLEQRMDVKVVAELQSMRDKADEKVQRYERNRRTVYEGGLARFTEEVMNEEASRKADPNAHVEHGEDAVTIGGVRVPKRERPPVVLAEL